MGSARSDASRQRTRRHSAVVLGFLAALATGCSGAGSSAKPPPTAGASTTPQGQPQAADPSTSAEAACRSGLEPNTEFLWAEPATVGEVRREVSSFGPRTGLGDHIFADQAKAALAYRCFANRGVNEIQEYAVLPDGQRSGICTAIGVGFIPGLRPGTNCV